MKTEFVFGEEIVATKALHLSLGFGERNGVCGRGFIAHDSLHHQKEELLRSLYFILLNFVRVVILEILKKLLLIIFFNSKRCSKKINELIKSQISIIVSI